KDYQFTEHVTVGQPIPLLSYFLVHGQAPHSVAFGVRNLAFHPESLVVQRRETGWVLSDGQQTLWSFGDQEAAAPQALRAVQRHRFDHLCWVGDLTPGTMMFLVRAGN